ncbi:MAG: orotate phosphoribosyltransferase [Pseudomonadota bacterium]
MTKEELARAVKDIAHLTGEFKLRSGQTSNEYFDKYRFEAQPTLLKEIAKQMATMIPQDTEILAGLEMGGIPVAVALSFETGLPVVFVRKEAKAYGTCKFAEGLEIEGKKLCVVEDVITTGGQVVISSKDLRESGAVIDTVVCVIHRGESPNAQLQEIGLNLQSLFTRADF